MKRVFSILLVVCILVGIAPVVYALDTGDQATTSVLDGWVAQTDLDITSNVKSATVEKITDPDKGETLVVSKPLDTTESTGNSKYVKLAEKTLDTPINLTSRKIYIDFDFKSEGRTSDPKAYILFMFNDNQLVLGFGSNGIVDRDGGGWWTGGAFYHEGSDHDATVKFYDGTWTRFRLELDSSDVENNNRAYYYTDNNKWQEGYPGGHYLAFQETINSLSVAYKTEGAVTTGGDLKTYIANISIHNGDNVNLLENPEHQAPLTPPVVNDDEWFGYQNVQRRDKDNDNESGSDRYYDITSKTIKSRGAIYQNISSSSVSSRVTPLTDADTNNHGEGVKISKTVDPSEWLQFSFAKLGTRNFAEPLAVTEDDVTTIEYWTKVEGRTQTAMVDGTEASLDWGLSHFFINDEPVVAMMNSGLLGKAGPNWEKGYCEPFKWGDPYIIPDGVWARFKLEFKNGVYDRTEWDGSKHVVVETNVPCTKMTLSVKAEEGVAPSSETDKWQSYGEIVLREIYDSIGSISFGYSKGNEAPITTSDLDIYVAGLSINGEGGVPEVNPDIYGGWYGYNDVKYDIVTGESGKTSVVNKGTDGENSAHPDYITVKKPVYTNEDIGFNYVKLGTTQLAAPVTISADENKPTCVEMWMKASNIADWGNAVIFINDQPFTGISNEGGIGYASKDAGWFCYMDNAIEKIGDDEWVKFRMEFVKGEFYGSDCVYTRTYVKKTENEEWIPEGERYGAVGTKMLYEYQDAISSISVGYRQSGNAEREKPAVDCDLKISVDGLKIDGMDAHEMLKVAKSGSEATATYALRAFAPTTQSAKVVLAVYDSNDVLIGTNISDASEIKFTGVDSTMGTAKTVTSSVSLPNNAAYVRAFAWDSEVGMTPLVLGNRYDITQ